jgi:hypothetical protein
MLFIAVGYSAAYFVRVLSPNPPCNASVLTAQLEAHAAQNDIYESEKLALLTVLDSLAVKLDSLQTTFEESKKTPGTVNFVDSSDFAITEAFIKRYGASSSIKLSVARDHLVHALNALDSLAMCRESVKDAEDVIKAQEDRFEAVLDLVDIQHSQVASLDSGLTKCIESHSVLENKNEELSQKLDKQKTKTSRWRLTAFVSLALNGIQAWLR